MNYDEVANGWHFDPLNTYCLGLTPRTDGIHRAPMLINTPPAHLQHVTCENHTYQEVVCCHNHLLMFPWNWEFWPQATEKGEIKNYKSLRVYGGTVP